MGWISNIVSSAKSVISSYLNQPTEDRQSSEVWSPRNRPVPDIQVQSSSVDDDYQDYFRRRQAAIASHQRMPALTEADLRQHYALLEDKIFKRGNLTAEAAVQNSFNLISSLSVLVRSDYVNGNEERGYAMQMGGASANYIIGRLLEEKRVLESRADRSKHASAIRAFFDAAKQIKEKYFAGEAVREKASVSKHSGETNIPILTDEVQEYAAASI